MPYSYTGIIYIFSAIVFGFGSYKFYKVWQKQRNFVSKIFAYLFGSIAIAFLIDGFFGGMFFLESPEIMNWIMILGFLTFGISLSILGYLAVYLKFPKISPKIGFFTMLFYSIGIGILNIFYPTHVFLEPTKFINWEFHPLVGILRSLSFVIPSIFLTIAFFHQARITVDRRIKTRAIGFGMAFLLVIITSGSDMISAGFIKPDPMIADVGLAVASLILLLVFILVPTIGEVPYKEKYEISDND
ncbi:MAG: hypothetical protein A2175_02110 [Candidatus Nealsonbacteria bacterium RBG_13_42_11]|uniref:Histidine kinase N-terminal 7TM region domain-containing protein n=1 Tax=Candidatus Nealsonbacteria bacterium RBG_13_42_11 TaxID=1801663 RepID=A0A1G2DZD7_9BACT|nr:MAG: hypothetical protein A2175_02110 [Candidatus Nealsonbacteria bacterium RBG_13_42_11]